MEAREVTRLNLVEQIITNKVRNKRSTSRAQIHNPIRNFESLPVRFIFVPYIERATLKYLEVVWHEGVTIM